MRATCPSPRRRPTAWRENKATVARPRRRRAPRACATHAPEAVDGNRLDRRARTETSIRDMATRFPFWRLESMDEFRESQGQALHVRETVWTAALGARRSSWRRLPNPVEGRRDAGRRPAGAPAADAPGDASAQDSTPSRPNRRPADEGQRADRAHGGPCHRGRHGGTGRAVELLRAPAGAHRRGAGRAGTSGRRSGARAN